MPVNSEMESYLTLIDKTMESVPASARAEIILEIKSHILAAHDKNPERSFESILASFGDPEKVAERYLAEAGLKPRRWSGLKWLGISIFCLGAFAGIFVLAQKLKIVSDRNRLEQAAILGDAGADYELGLIYEKGWNVKIDYTTALKHFQRAAEQGHSGAQYSMGFFNEKAMGVPKDYAKALKWFLKAAEQGHSGGEYSMGFFNEHGMGIPVDDKKALEWYKKSAAHGHCGAEYSMGFFYENGLAVKKDLTKATAWYERALAHGHGYAAQKIKELQMMQKIPTPVE